MRGRTLAVDTLIATAMTSVALLIGEDSELNGWPEVDPLGCALLIVVNLSGALRGVVPGGVAVVVFGGWALYISAGYWPAPSVRCSPSTHWRRRVPPGSRSLTGR